MTAWHEGPLEGFDLETTGPDPETARIVTACYARQEPGGAVDCGTILVDPGVPVPDEATAVHGITTERAQDEGIAAGSAANWVAMRLDGVPFDPAPLVIYNAPYDLTVADREARRHTRRPAGWPSAPDRLIIDPFVLDKAADRYRKGSRKLADTCKHYGVKLDNAHDAAADTVAAIELARAIARRYPDIARMTPAELHAFQVKAKAEQAASFQDYLRRQGSSEVIDPSWPVIEWREPEPGRVSLPVPEARTRLLRSALRCIGSGLTDDSADADAEAEYADEQLVLAARELVKATDALKAERQPVGWAS